VFSVVKKMINNHRAHRAHREINSVLTVISVFNKVLNNQRAQRSQRNCPIFPLKNSVFEKFGTIFAERASEMD
jgi:hypothetical protein